MQITVTHIRSLLASSAEEPVLYVALDEGSGAPTGVEVWASAYVPRAYVVATRSEIADLVDADTPADDEVLADLMVEMQETLSSILAAQD